MEVERCSKLVYILVNPVGFPANQMLDLKEEKLAFAIDNLGRTKKEIVLNKPIYAGMCILDLSKLWMYRFHYDVIKKQYGSRAKLLFTDTDSLCYHVKTQNFFQDVKDRSELYDLSNYPKDSPYFDGTNKKVLGKFKDECEGKSPSEFIGLRPKMYSLKVGEGGEKKAKGVKRAFVKQHLCHADYRRCLMSDERKDKQQRAKFNVLRAQKHVNRALEIQKVGLCAYDNKRYLLDDGIESHSYGHYRIGEPQNSLHFHLNFLFLSVFPT